MEQASTESPASKSKGADAAATALEVRYEFTPILPDILKHVRSSLFVTTYQAGKLMVLGAVGNELKIAFHSFEQPMGLAIDESRLALGTKRHIQGYVGNREVAAAVPPVNSYDLCLVPRNATYTGNIHGHDLAWGHDGLWVVNTLFSCLCQLHEDFCFVPRWKPPFISQLADQDRCHLNGLAMDSGRPRFMTAMAETDTPAGWRPTKATSGVILDIASGAVVSHGLCMPHSPRVHQGRLWVLDSGRGALCVVDLQTGQLQTVETFPGYVRGLSFAGQFAFVGLSRIRETSVFGGVPIAEHRESLKCGIGVVDLVSGRTVAVFQFLSGVTEIFAVETVTGATNPVIAGQSNAEDGHDVWIVPPHGHQPSMGPVLPWYQRIANSTEKPERHTAAQWIEEGNRLQVEQKPVEAITCYERALSLDNTCVPGWQNLGYLLMNEGHYEKSLAAFERLRTLENSPLNRLLSASVLPVIYSSHEQIAQAREHQFQQLTSLANDAGRIDAMQTLLPTFFYAPYHGQENTTLMRLKKQVILGADFVKSRVTHRSSSDRIRIGFISAYLHDHTIGRLNAGRIEKLDRTRFHVSTFLASNRNDRFTQRLQSSSDHFCRLPPNLRAAAQALASQELDLLLFTDIGMDALTTTLAQSRFAPIQISTWGHPETSGSPNMDYFLSSSLLEPPGAEQNYTEALLLLDRLGIYYENPRSEVNRTRGRSQFGLPESATWYVCPQSLFKFHPDFDAIIAGILTEDRNGILVTLEGKSSEWTRRLRARWELTMPELLDRIHFLPALPHADYLRLLELADVMLDPIHFGGGNSSYEALAVGTPIVTMPGQFLRSRITYGLYQTIRFNALIATTPSEYIQLATTTARNPDLRKSLSTQIQTQHPTLFENPSDVTSFEDKLQSLTPRPR